MSSHLKTPGGPPGFSIDCIMKQHIGLVYTIINSRLQGVCTREDIEECVSDVFYEAATKYKAMADEEKGTVKAFLAVLARRRAIDTWRRVKNSYNPLPLDEIPLEIKEPSTENKIVDQETRQALLKEIKSLGWPDSEIFIRKFYFSQTAKEIANALDLKENTVNKKVSRGLKKLKKLKKLLGGNDGTESE